MLAAEVDANGKMAVLASERQVVRLGTSVFREGRLNEPTMNLACDVLAGCLSLPGRTGGARRAAAAQARSSVAKTCLLRLRMGCSIKFQDSQAESTLGGRAISVSCHHQPTLGKRQTIDCSMGKWKR
jgi:hypothetical protein